MVSNREYREYRIAYIVRPEPEIEKRPSETARREPEEARVESKRVGEMGTITS